MALLTLVALLAGCTGTTDSRATGTTSTSSAPDSAVPPELAVGANVTVPATLPIPDDFVAPDTRGVKLAPVLAKPKKPVDHTKPILAIEEGDAKLHGRVWGPDGPMPEEDAVRTVVRLERFVGEDFGVLNVAVKKDGTWEAKDIRGGRYRLRAFRMPNFATTEPQPFFLPADKGEGNVDLTMERYEGQLLQGALDVAEPHIGEKVTLRTLLSQEAVEDDGVVRGKGIPAADVQVTLLGGVRVIGPDNVATDEAGFALFTVMCTAGGVNALNITSSGQTTTVELPNCLEGTVDPRDLTPGTGPTVAIGLRFTVPIEGPLPAGTYKAVSVGNCGTVFEVFANNTWVRTISLDRTIVTPNPIRTLTALIGTTPCTFERST